MRIDTKYTMFTIPFWGWVVVFLMTTWLDHIHFYLFLVIKIKQSSSSSAPIELRPQIWFKIIFFPVLRAR